VKFSVATWNINSVRLRIGLVERFLKEAQVDVLCLQETKCPDDKLPLSELRGFGYPYIAHRGMKGYNGVAILSRFPLAAIQGLDWCGREDARHVAVTLAPEAGPAGGVTIHNFYVPAGGDIPDPEVNEKFAHKLNFLAEMRAWAGRQGAGSGPVIVVGDLNVAPLEHDVWSHRQMLDVVSHTPVETQALEALREEAGLVDAPRRLKPEPEKVYTWWSYRSPDWRAADKGRRLDHVWLTPDLADALRSVDVHKDCRGWDRPSDHVPLVATMEL
jgi:exodeoxyribonuclease-3